MKRLRGNLGAAALVTSPYGYQISAADDDIDVAVFRHLTQAGLRALRASDWAGASESLTSALALWRGRAFGDVPSELLARQHAVGLGEMRIQALEAKLTANLKLGRAEDVVAELLPLVAAEPLRERLYSLLMLGFYQTGQQAAALSVYARARRMLAEEIGIEPGPELRELHHRILQGDPALTAA